ncbi:uncharacterized protein LOC144919057 [Branchiostoma floridae x Branchiostoma belcheri]
MPPVFPTCPEGTAFEGDPIYDCIPCDLCAEFPNTGICSTQTCIDFLRESVTSALQLSTQGNVTLTDTSPDQETAWVWVLVAWVLVACLVVVTAAILRIRARDRKRRRKVILGNREDKRDIQVIPLADMAVEKLNFSVENTEPPSSESFRELSNTTQLENDGGQTTDSITDVRVLQ